MSIALPSFPNMYLPRKDIAFVFAFSMRPWRYLVILRSGWGSVGFVVVSLVAGVWNVV